MIFSRGKLLRIKGHGIINDMKKMISRTALVASLMFAAVSLTACGSTNDCPNAVGDSGTVTTAMLPAKGGHGGGHSSSHSTSHGTSGSHSGGFRMPYWFGSSHSECKSNTDSTSKP